LAPRSDDEGSVEVNRAEAYASRWLDNLETHRMLGGPVRLCRRRREQLLYLVVGGWNTLFGYAIWALFEYLLSAHLHYLVILVISWPFAVLNAYFCYRHFVFHSRDRIRRELPRFSLVYLVTLTAGLLALPLLLRTLPFNIYIIQAGYTAVVVVLSYLAHRFFSFGGSRSRGVVHDGETDVDSLVE
jgi:putative flippase GtrA